MPKYRKKPVVIEAMRIPGLWEINDRIALEEWVGGPNDIRWRGDGLVINTLEGEMTGRPDDMLIRGVNGEFYPCKPHIFAATYEEIE